jgi:hypothetical protein
MDDSETTHQIRHEDLAVELKRHMRMGRTIPDREFNGGRIFLEMKWVSGNSCDDRAIGRAKLEVSHVQGCRKEGG